MTKFFTVAEVAKSLDVHVRTARRWIKSNMLIAHKIGGVLRIAEEDLRAFLARYRGV